MKFLKRLRGPFWVLCNLARACWFRELIYMAERHRQKPLRRALLLVLIDIEIIATYVFYALCVLVLGHLATWLAVVVLPIHAARVEITRAHNKH